MAFCSECGRQIADGSKFCDGCGKPVIGASARKSVYDGVIHKCPNCGEVLQAFSPVCPACGHELRDTEASKSVREFAEKLEQIASTRATADRTVMDNADLQAINLINTFPVPNTKEDLFEFVTLAASNIDTSVLDDTIPESSPQKALCRAWQRKLNQVYNKSIMVFEEDDPNFLKIQSVYNEIQEQIGRQKKTQATKFRLWVLVCLTGTILSVILYVVSFTVTRFGGYFGDGNSSMLQVMATVLLIVTAVLSRKDDAGVISSLGVIAASVGLICFSVVLDWHYNTSMMMVGGVVSLIIAAVNLIRFALKHSRIRR